MHNANATTETTMDIAAAERLTPRPDQDAAVRAVVGVFAAGEPRAQLIAPPGVGKTLMSLWIAERLEAEFVLFFAPSLSLIAQTADAWFAQHDGGTPLRALAVCSDETVGEDIQRADVPIPVTTDPDALASFLRSPPPPGTRVVVLATYQSVGAVEAGLARAGFRRGGREVPLAVLDEAHRVAGPEGKRFQIALDASRIPAARRLSMTATPRILATHQRRTTPDGELLVASMDDTERFGSVAYRLSYGDAIRLGLLADYRIDVLVVRDRDVRQRILAGDEDILALAQATATVNALDAGAFRHAFSFHHTKVAALRFLEAVRRVAGDNRASDWTTEAVFGDWSVAARRRALDAMFGAPRGLIANVKALAEGIDAPALDAIVFVDPKASVVDIAQIAGRALRRDPRNPQKLAHIVVPLVLTGSEGAAGAEEELRTSTWEPVWRLLAAMAAHDDRLEQELALAVRRRAAHETGAPTPDTADAESLLSRSLVLALPPDIPLERFRHAVAVRAVVETSDPWEYGFGRLEAYVARAGSARMPAEHVEPDGFRLGDWAVAQRMAFASGRLAPDRAARLAVVDGWWWGRDSAVWERWYGRLQRFVRQHGHARGPHMLWTRRWGWLGLWLAVQRSTFQSGRLRPTRAETLRVLPGWTWADPHSMVDLPSTSLLDEPPVGAAAREFLTALRSRRPSLPPSIPRIEDDDADAPREARRGRHSWLRTPVPPITNWAARSYLPWLLREAGLEDAAEQLEGSDAVVDLGEARYASDEITAVKQQVTRELNAVLKARRSPLGPHTGSPKESAELEALLRDAAVDPAATAAAPEVGDSGVTRRALEIAPDIALLALLRAEQRGRIRVEVDPRIRALEALTGWARRRRRFRQDEDSETSWGVVEWVVETFFEDEWVRRALLGGDGDASPRSPSRGRAEDRWRLKELVSGIARSQNETRKKRRDRRREGRYGGRTAVAAHEGMFAQGDAPGAVVRRFLRASVDSATWWTTTGPRFWRGRGRSMNGRDPSPRDAMRIAARRWTASAQAASVGRVAGITIGKLDDIGSSEIAEHQYIVAEHYEAPWQFVVNRWVRVESAEDRAVEAAKLISSGRDPRLAQRPRPTLFALDVERVSKRATTGGRAGGSPRAVVLRIPNGLGAEFARAATFAPSNALPGLTVLAARPEHIRADADGSRWYHAVWLLETPEGGKEALPPAPRAKPVKARSTARPPRCLALHQGLVEVRAGQVVGAVSTGTTDPDAHWFPAWRREDSDRVPAGNCTVVRGTLRWRSPPVEWRGEPPHRQSLVPHDAAAAHDHASPHNGSRDVAMAVAAVPASAPRVARGAGSAHRSAMPDGTIVENRDERFEFNLASLREYAAAHGHLRPKKKDRPRGVNLYVFLQRMERAWRENALPVERWAALNEIPAWRARLVGSSTGGPETAAVPGAGEPAPSGPHRPPLRVVRETPGVTGAQKRSSTAPPPPHATTTTTTTKSGVWDDIDTALARRAVWKEKWKARQAEERRQREARRASQEHDESKETQIPERP